MTPAIAISDENLEKLIELVRKNPCIYNPSKILTFMATSVHYFDIESMSPYCAMLGVLKAILWAIIRQDATAVEFAPY